VDGQVYMRRKGWAQKKNAKQKGVGKEKNGKATELSTFTIGQTDLSHPHYHWATIYFTHH
jgi:hypothetical protein